MMVECMHVRSIVHVYVCVLIYSHTHALNMHLTIRNQDAGTNEMRISKRENGGWLY